jgi:hypothetical protein
MLELRVHVAHDAAEAFAAELARQAGITHVDSVVPTRTASSSWASCSP